MGDYLGKILSMSEDVKSNLQQIKELQRYNTKINEDMIRLTVEAGAFDLLQLNWAKINRITNQRSKQ